MRDLVSYLAAFGSAFMLHLRRFWFAWIVVLVALAIVAWIGLQMLIAPSSDFPSHTVFVIERGDTVQEVAHELADADLITYPHAFSVAVRLMGGDRGIQAGSYRFDAPANLVEIAERLTKGDTRAIPEKITFPEGQTVREMSERIAAVLPVVSTVDFFKLAKPHEGYLFPDTYFFAHDATASLIVDTMRANFDTRIASITPEISASGHTLHELITMASLIEKEARTTENRRIIAGILWNRIELGMPLQVDAVFGYINNRSTYSPTLEELTIDSPYNTYTRQGLPPGPIGNPGLDTIGAALHPAQTDYLFYLTDKEGGIHFAHTFAEHKANRTKYLLR